MSCRPVLLLLAVFTTACTSDVERARELVADSLVMTDDLEFHEVRAYPGDVVCGEFSATVSLTRPRAEYQPFVVMRGELDSSPSSRALELICNDDPVAAVEKALGVGPINRDNAALAKVLNDLHRLTTVLEHYYRDNFFYPTAAQGLQALASRPQSARPLPNYPEGGYLNSIPLDPWQRPYIYTEEQWGRVKGRYEIRTLGQAGSPGGQGVDADISSNDLSYLTHAARVAGITVAGAD